MAASLAWNPGSGTMMLYSGNGADDPGLIRDDAWTWDGEAWTRCLREQVRSPAAGPRRWWRATTGRPWSTAGTRWPTRPCRRRWATRGCWPTASGRSTTTRAAPAPLVNARALAHPTLGILLAGGSDFDRENGDVWRWTGDRWEIFARDVLPPRQAFGMAYDEARGVVVLTGGVVAAR